METLKTDRSTLASQTTAVAVAGMICVLSDACPAWSRCCISATLRHWHRRMPLCTAEPAECTTTGLAEPLERLAYGDPLALGAWRVLDVHVSHIHPRMSAAARLLPDRTRSSPRRLALAHSHRRSCCRAARQRHAHCGSTYAHDWVHLRLRRRAQKEGLRDARDNLHAVCGTGTRPHDPST